MRRWRALVYPAIALGFLAAPSWLLAQQEKMAPAATPAAAAPAPAPATAAESAESALKLFAP